jgi:hypothetical protein
VKFFLYTCLSTDSFDAAPRKLHTVEDAEIPVFTLNTLRLELSTCARKMRRIRSDNQPSIFFSGGTFLRFAPIKP